MSGRKGAYEVEFCDHDGKRHTRVIRDTNPGEIVSCYNHRYNLHIRSITEVLIDKNGVVIF
jgi:hypothetical protein